MPYMFVRITPSIGQHKKEIIQNLMQKCEVEKIKEEGKAHGFVTWDARPEIYDVGRDWEAKWRYKQGGKKS